MKKRILYWLLPRGPFNLRGIAMYLLGGITLLLFLIFIYLTAHSLYLSHYGERSEGEIISLIQTERELTYYYAIIRYTDLNEESHLTDPLPIQRSFVERYHHDISLMNLKRTQLIYDKRHPHRAKLVDYSEILYPFRYLFYSLITLLMTLFFATIRHFNEPTIKQPDLYFDPNNPNHWKAIEVKEPKRPIESYQERAKAREKALEQWIERHAEKKDSPPE